MPKNEFLTIMIAKNTFLKVKGGGLKVVIIKKKISFSNSATKKLSREAIKKIRGVTL